jgi:peptidoglycan/xylan/chitin deacetylase (PgdA/CDA1 family)
MRAILTWHSIDPSGSAISVPRDVFRRQVAWLASGRARVVSVETLLTMPADADAVALTFDDGFANFETEAAPLFAEHRLPATVFVVAGQVGRDNGWPGSSDAVPRLPLMDWEALGRIQRGGISIGAHTWSHPRLPALDAPAVEEELARSADEIGRRLGRRPAGFAYPYGARNAHVSDAVAARYEWACTTEFRALASADSRQALPRLDAWYLRSPRLLEAWGTARFRAWVWARRQGRVLRQTVSDLGGRT